MQCDLNSSTVIQCDIIALNPKGPSPESGVMTFTKFRGNETLRLCCERVARFYSDKRNQSSIIVVVGNPQLTTQTDGVEKMADGKLVYTLTIKPVMLESNNIVIR